MNDDGTKHMAGPIQDGDSDELKAEQVKIMNAIKRDRTRVRRLRVLTSVLWGAFVVGFIMASILRQKLKEMSPMESMMLGCLVIALALILVVVVVCTASLYIRSRSLDQRQVLASLAGIERSLQELHSKRGDNDTCKT
jgi:hypothetical protein